MKSRAFVVSISLVLLLAGCAGLSRTEDARDQVFSDLRSAALSTQAIGVIEHGKSSILKIGASSPSLDVPDIKGKFEVVSISGEKDRPFTMHVVGLCDCLGFRKQSVVPLAYLVDETGRTVSTMQAMTPTALELKGSFAVTGVHRLVVVADQSRAGERVGSIGGGAAIPGGVFVPNLFTLPMTAHPTGKFAVAYPKEPN